MTTVDLAIKNLPKKDKEYRSYAFALRADVYVRLENIDNALCDYATAIDLTPERIKLYERLTNLYYQLENIHYEDAVAQFDYVIKLASDMYRDIRFAQKVI